MNGAEWLAQFKQQVHDANLPWCEPCGGPSDKQDGWWMYEWLLKGRRVMATWCGSDDDSCAAYMRRGSPVEGLTETGFARTLEYYRAWLRDEVIGG